MTTQTTAPRERPMLMGEALVRAVLAGTKTQTRRPLSAKWLHHVDFIAGRGDSESDPSNYGFQDGEGTWWVLGGAEGSERNLSCRLGEAGDRLWIRETWTGADCMYQGHELDTPGVIAYRADKSAIQFNATPQRQIPTWDLATWNWDSLNWRPSIHMPRWASRLSVEITNVRVERLHDISDADIAAEGVTRASVLDLLAGLSTKSARAFLAELPGATPRDLWRITWSAIYGSASWDANPFLWALDFKRLP